MSKRPTIREQIDACRPDSDDPHMPEHAAELAEFAAGLRESDEIRSQWELSQQNDRILRGAMQDVSLPTGLEARLLAAVQSSSVIPLAGVERAAGEDSPACENPVAPVRPATSRRRFLQIAGALGGTAALVLAAVLVFQSGQKAEQPITKDQLAAQVEAWLGTVDLKALPAATKESRKAFPSETVLGSAQRAGTISSEQGEITAYDVALGSNHATLLVIPTSQVYPVGSFPLTNLSGVSGGWQVRAWQSGGSLYVIAVRSNSDARLDHFIRPQAVG